MVGLMLLLTQCSETSSEWKYFGQERPGQEPEVFAPGIISGKGRIHCFPAISPDGKEIYWMTLPPRIYVSKFIGGRWTVAEPAEAFREIPCLRPSFSSDGKRIYFSSNLDGGYGSLDIWYIERIDSGFSAPVNIGAPLNSPTFEAQQTLTRKGNIYFTGTVPGKRWNRGILRSEFVNGSYTKPEPLPEPINLYDSNSVDYTPFISGDESFLLFSSNRLDPVKESCRIYVSFREEGQKWTDPVDLSQEMGFYEDSRDPCLSPDGKFLFFSNGENIFWVDASVIGRIRNKY